MISTFRGQDYTPPINTKIVTRGWSIHVKQGSREDIRSYIQSEVITPEKISRINFIIVVEGSLETKKSEKRFLEVGINCLTYT